MKRPLVVGFLCLTCIALAACGNSSPANTGTASSAGAEAAKPRAATKSGAPTGPLRVVERGSAGYGETGHYRKVPKFGTEAEEGELEQAATVLHVYLIALAERNWSEACSSVSHRLVEELEARSRKLAGKPCPALLSTVVTPSPAGSTYEATEVEAESLRSNGKRGFLLYRAATAPYFAPMVQEGGTWKMAAPNSTPFYSYS